MRLLLKLCFFISFLLGSNHALAQDLFNETSVYEFITQLELNSTLQDDFLETMVRNDKLFDEFSIKLFNNFDFVLKAAANENFANQIGKNETFLNNLVKQNAAIELFSKVPQVVKTVFEDDTNMDDSGNLKALASNPKLIQAVVNNETFLDKVNMDAFVDLVTGDKHFLNALLGDKPIANLLSADDGIAGQLMDKLSKDDNSSNQSATESTVLDQTLDDEAINKLLSNEKQRKDFFNKALKHKEIAETVKLLIIVPMIIYWIAAIICIGSMCGICYPFGLSDSTSASKKGKKSDEKKKKEKAADE